MASFEVVQEVSAHCTDSCLPVAQRWVGLAIVAANDCAYSRQERAKEDVAIVWPTRLPALLGCQVQCTCYVHSLISCGFHLQLQGKLVAQVGQQC